MKLFLELPVFPPTVNSMYFNAGKGRVKTPEARVFSQAVTLKCKQRHALAGRLRLEVFLYPAPKRRRFDIDNRVKAIQDALQGANVYEDDSQIDELVVRRMETTRDERCLVCVEEIDEQT